MMMEIMETKKDYIYDVALSPNFLEDGICFAGRETGLWRSQNGGQTWQNVFESLGTEQQISALAVCLSPNFALDGLVFVGSTGVMLKSEDKGNSWTALKLASPLPLVSCLLLSPDFEKDQTVYVGTLDDGVYVSASCGESYTGWNYGLMDQHVYSLAVTNGVVCAGVESGIFRSTNGGRYWMEVDFPMDVAPVNALLCNNAGIMLAGTEENGLYCSEDYGQQWSQISPAIFSGAVNHLMQSKKTGLLLAASDEAVFLSADEGQTWQERWRVTSGFGIASLAVDESFDVDSPLLIGLASGVIEVVR